MESYGATLKTLGERARELRILRNLRQQELAERAGLGTGTVIRFERSGKATFENVLRIAHVLGAEGAFEELFALPKYRSIDEVLAPAPAARQRVRTRR